MKNLIFTLAFTIFTSFTFAQTGPQFIIEQSASGYDISLLMEDVSNLSSVKVQGVLKQNSFTEKINIDLDVNDVKSNWVFQSLENKNIHAEFEVIVTDANGVVKKYPVIDLNIVKS